MIRKLDSKLIIILLLFAVFFGVIILLAYFSPAKIFSDTNHEGISLVRDDQELSVFYDRVKFYIHRSIPYRYSRIEYPPLAVLYLTIPAIFSDTFDCYKFILITQNVIFGILLVLVTYRIITILSKSKKILWLFILPSFVFYLINRFDVFPAFLVQLSLLLLLRKKFIWSFVILSMAFLTKGYALFLFPIFFVYYLNQTNQYKASLFKNRWLWIMLIPTIVITIILCLLAGLENGLFPYIYQTSRGFGYGSVYVIYLKALEIILPSFLFLGYMKITSLLLTFLQVILPVLVYICYNFFRRFVKSAEDLISWSLLAILLYVQFSPYYSPQWFVWLLPFLILFAKTRKEFFLIVVYDIINYLQFPVAWDYFGYNSLAFDIFVFIRTILFILIIISVSQSILRKYQKNSQLIVNG